MLFRPQICQRKRAFSAFGGTELQRSVRQRWPKNWVERNSVRCLKEQKLVNSYIFPIVIIAKIARIRIYQKQAQRSN